MIDDYKYVNDEMRKWYRNDDEWMLEWFEEIPYTLIDKFIENTRVQPKEWMSNTEQHLAGQIRDLVDLVARLRDLVKETAEIKEMYEDLLHCALDVVKSHHLYHEYEKKCREVNQKE